MAGGGRHNRRERARGARLMGHGDDGVEKKYTASALIADWLFSRAPAARKVIGHARVPRCPVLTATPLCREGSTANTPQSRYYSSRVYPRCV
uniref:Uncharacterized protein n=1 Tax=Oryza nivara TaxID=4536 RepID=A0A0E0I8I1_ORYNI